MARAIVVVDYHKGNLSSVERGLLEAGGEVVVSDNPDVISAAAGVVLPGVGSFGDAMAFLRESGEAEAILSAIDHEVPFLGICLGLQLLFERGSETDDGSWAEGLGVFSGSATRLESSRLKVPHVGWDQIHLTPRGGASRLFRGVPEGANVYFTHSFALDNDVEQGVVAARTHYVRSFASAIWDGNVFGVQFHPEKSSAVGAQILSNFVDVVRGGR